MSFANGVSTALAIKLLVVVNVSFNKENEMKDVMVDLETVGRRAGCGILSIGAVAFDPNTGDLGPEFYMVVKLDSCEKFGLHNDPDTLAWWEKQSPEAQKVLTQARASRGNKPLDKALVGFNEYLSQFGPKAVRVWGNGSDFDNAILINCYAATELTAGWEFWNNRCFRTLKGLAPSIKTERVGTYHNALDDAKTQAIHAMKVFSQLRGAK
jgi:3' exoribonuclease, RNase T-like